MRTILTGVDYDPRYHAVRGDECTCYDALYHGPGKLSAEGPCKHVLYVALVQRAHATSVEAVKAYCLSELKRFLHAREASKGEGEGGHRDVKLFAATYSRAETSAESLIALLRENPSCPPSGKSEQPAPSAHRPQPPDEDAERAGDSSEEEEAMTDPTPRTCTFHSTSAGLGLICVRMPDQGDSRLAGAVRVVAYCPLLDGRMGPAAHSGVQIEPMDVVLQVNQVTASKLLGSDGRLQTDGKSVELRFEKCARGRATEVGGAPATLKSKSDYSQRRNRPKVRGGGGGTGGTPGAISHKPEAKRGTQLRGRTNAQSSSGEHNVTTAKAMEEQLLRKPRLTRDELHDLVVEHEGSVYIS